MKARDIRAALQGDYDPKLVNIICTVAENAAAQAQEIREMAVMMDKLTGILMSFLLPSAEFS